MREALRTLRGEGMVELEPHRGHRVVPLTRGDIEDIFWLQSTIAQELAAAATLRITDDEIAELSRLNARMAVAVEHRAPDEIALAEFTFHRTFNRSSGRKAKPVVADVDPELAEIEALLRKRGIT